MQFIVKDEPYVFFDEMSVHSFMYTKKAWSYRDQPIVAVVNSGSRYSQSVYGSIGNVFKKPILQFSGITNSENCLEYFKYLKQEADKVTTQKLNIILDNAPAHTAVKTGVKPFLQANFNVHYMPKGTPQVNAIEHFWSSYKARVKKLLFNNPDMPLNANLFRTKVEAVGNSYTAQEVQNMLRSSNAYMLNLLYKFQD